MTEHDDDRRPDEAKADEVERELDEMHERQQDLGGEIDDAGDKWERQKRDERVPGATGEVEDEDEDDEGDGPPPEAQEPPKEQDDEPRKGSPNTT